MEKAEPGAKRILSGMVADTLALAHAEVVVQSVSALQPGAGGDAEKWYHEGQRYFCGRGVPKDYAEALKWYRKAADQGHALAQTASALAMEEEATASRKTAQRP